MPSNQNFVNIIVQIPLLNDTPLIHFRPLLSIFQPKWGISEIVYEGL